MLERAAVLGGRLGSPAGTRGDLLNRRVQLEVFSVGYNMIEGLIAVLGAIVAGSVALLGFGVDSFVESASALVVIWRIEAEKRATNQEAVERAEARALRLVAISLFAIAAYITWEAGSALWQGERPETSYVGIGLTLASIVVMLPLSMALRANSLALGSRALEHDAFQTMACWWLSWTVLIGLGLNALFGWWWADPLAALIVVGLLVREAREAWEGEDCCAL